MFGHGDSEKPARNLLVEDYARSVLQFMDHVVADASPEQELHVILDNYCTHKKCDAWLAQHPQVHFHFTPTSASTCLYSFFTSFSIFASLAGLMFFFFLSVISFLRSFNDPCLEIILSALSTFFHKVLEDLQACAERLIRLFLFLWNFFLHVFFLKALLDPLVERHRGHYGATAFSADLKAIAVSEEYVSATAKAEAKIREVQDNEVLSEGSTSEMTNDGYRVDVGVTSTLNERTDTLQVMLMDILVTVRWSKGAKEKSLSLRTMKLVNKQI
jgi:alpha-L-arabinofuranosidase